MRVNSAAGNSSVRQARTEELARELLGRCKRGEIESDPLTSIVGGELVESLRSCVDVFHNPFSVKRFADLFRMYHGSMREFSSGFGGSTCVEIGSGSLNPMGLCLLLLVAGARRTVAVDLDPVQDDALACRALAGLAAQVFIDASAVFGDYPVTTATAVERLGSFDLGLLQKGLASGIDGEKLSHRCESVCRLSLADAEADYVFSNAFLEHVEDTDGAIRELSRVTRQGGIHVHCIDTSDHCRYTDGSLHPLEFLKVRTADRFVNTSNRLRLCQFIPLFEQHGFEVLRNDVTESVVVDDALRQSFAEPFRSMSLEDLGQVVSLVVLRKSNP